MQHVNPLVRMRLTHPKELSLHLLKGMLFHLLIRPLKSKDVVCVNPVVKRLLSF
jgi:hypothetical protein